MPAPEKAGLDSPMDPALSITELRDAVDQLMKGKAIGSRAEILNLICCRAAAGVSELRIIGEALTSGVELLEWRVSIAQAADAPTRLTKAMPEIFVLYAELAVQAFKWYSQILSGDLRESLSQRDLQDGAPKIQRAVLRLSSTVFEVAAEAYLSDQSSLFKEPFLLTFESLILISFEVVTAIYRATMRKPSPQPGDDEMQRKRCQELLTSTYRHVLVFRRQIGNKISVANENYQQLLQTALRVVASAVKSSMELGELSTSRGEISVVLLSVSWKSILALLQVNEGRDVVASVVDIATIIATLISNAVQVSKRAVENWLLLPSTSGQKDPRKQCIPMKFFLTTALKISSFYPLKAVMSSRNMVSCASKVYACLLHKDLIVHKAATEAFAEIVVPTAFALLHNLLNEQCVGADEKIQILQEITRDADGSSQEIADLDDCHEGNDIVDELFGNKPAMRPGAGILKSGKVMLFQFVLRASGNYSTAVLSELLRNLPWLLEEVSEEGTYVLMTQKVYLPDGCSEMSGKWKWQLMFPWVSQGIKCFAVVAAELEPIWTDFKYFLFDHMLHPCTICEELILDVWTFIIRQGDSKLAEDHVDSLLSLLQDMSSSKAEATLQRRLARVLCGLVQAAPDTVAVRVYENVFQTNPLGSAASVGIVTKFLQEGFPFNKPASETLFSSCIASGKGLVDSLKLEGRGLTSKLAAQKPALTCLLLLLSQSVDRGENAERKYLEEIKQIVHNLVSMYIQELKYSLLFHTCGIIGPTLELIPHVQHLLDPVILLALLPRLLELCQSTAESAESNDLKQALPEFLANLSGIVIPEDENNPAMKALWGLYHSVLREKHWALVHMGLQSFSHFAEHTSCEELWRFVPVDAAVGSTVHAEDDGFMTVLKEFIEKECALPSLTTSEEELQLTRTECSVQQKKRKYTHDGVHRQKDVDEVVGVHPANRGGSGPGSGSFEIQEVVAMMCKGIDVLKERAPDLLNGESAHQWEAFRSKMSEWMDK